MRNIKISILKFVRKIPFLYDFTILVYRIILFPKILAHNIDYNKRKRKAFREYETNKGLLKINYGGYDLKFKAFSAKNYWHLTMGSQDENLFFKKLFKKIKKNMIIYDIGGHVGMYTLPFAKIVGNNGKVYVFEPENNGLNSINQNLAINEITNVKSFPFAISDKTSKSNFYVRPDKDTHSLFENSPAPSKTGKQNILNIQTYTIDDLIKKGFAIPDFIKIDTEGAELKILDGIKLNYEKLKYIFIEIHPTALALENIKNPEEVLEKKLTDLGFGYFEYFDKIHLLAKRVD